MKPVAVGGEYLHFNLFSLVSWNSSGKFYAEVGVDVHAAPVDLFQAESNNNKDTASGGVTISVIDLLITVFFLLGLR